MSKQRKNKNKGQTTNTGNAVASAGKKQPEASWLRWSPLLIVAVVLVLYWRVTGFDYIGLDDTVIIKAKTFLLSNFANLKMAFTTDAFLESTGSFYRPLQTMSFMVDAHLGGAQPFWYHLTNLLVFAIGCVTVLWLLLTLGYSKLQSTMLTLFYAVHPLFVSTVAWIPSRGDTFLTIFSTLTLIFFIRAYRRGDSLSLLLHAVALFLAFLSKETAMVVPVLCVAYYVVEFRSTHGWSSLVRFVAVWIPVTLIWLYLHSKLNTVQAAGNLIGVSSFIANIQTIPETFGKFFAPVQFKLIPLFNSTDTFIGVAMMAVVAGLITWRKKWSDPRVLLGLFWFMLFITPVMIYRKEDAQFMFEYLYHRAFIASIGLVIVIAQLVGTAFDGPKAKLATVISAGVIALCAIATMMEVGYYKNGETFFTEAAVRTPNSSMSYNNIGLARRSNGQYREAIESFSKALSIQSTYSKAYINRGGVYFMLGELENALSDFNHGIALDSSSADAYSNRCAIEQRMGRLQEALADINIALQLNPYYSDGYQNRGVVKNTMRMFADAIPDFNEAIRINPENAQAYFGRGIAKRNLQDTQGACADWTQAVALGSKDAANFKAKYCQ